MTEEETDLWELAEENADVLRFGTLFTARQVNRYLSDRAGIDEAADWCRRQGIRHLYLEVFRSEVMPEPETLARARDRLQEAGFLVSGCITPSHFGRQSTGWDAFSCFTAEETRRKLRHASERAAELFDEVMIDDFLCSDCTCSECREARGDRSWSEFKRELMFRMSRENIIGAGRAVNPDVEFIIKYPEWHEMYQERGYDVAAQTELFPQIWVGTETRGLDPSELEEPDEAHLRQEPQYAGYWLMRWLLGIGGEKCGGGWYDTIDTTPSFYVEQGRQTVLGGAPEAFLFNFGAIYEGRRYDHGRGPADFAALRREIPQHYELARLVRGRRPRGLLGWKPTNSPAGPDRNLHGLLGNAGFPVTAAHEFDPDAPGFIFSYHVLHDPAWWDAAEHAMETGRPIVATPAFLETARPLAEGNRLDIDRLEGRAVVLPGPDGPDQWAAMEDMPQRDLDGLREAACDGLGLTFRAPHDVALYLFDGEVAVVENFRNEAVECELRPEGWSRMEPALRIPADADSRVADDAAGHLRLAGRSLLAVRRA
ncbi:MAG: hypothetical protein ACOC7T_04715 [Planctomycetota bacterium]